MESDIAKQAMKNVQEAMSGAAEEAGLKSEEDVAAIKESKKEYSC